VADHVTLPLRCAHCGGALSLEIQRWDDESPAAGVALLTEDPTGDELPQGRVAFTTFPCPYCQRLNHGRLGGQFARVSGSFSYSAGLDASSMARRIRLVATVS
jgi:hypothetical protein